MRIGVIGIPGRWSSERLADALAARTGQRLLVPMADLRLDLGSGRTWAGELALDELDALVVKKVGPDYGHEILERLELLRNLAAGGLPVFSDPARIARAVDRLSCTIELRRGGIPIPDTTVTESVDVACDAVARYGRAVLKPLFTSKARGMVVVADGRDARGQIEEFATRNPLLYVQRMVEMPDRDIGIVFLGGRYLATYARVRTPGSWTTTTHFGGRYEPAEPAPAVIEMAERAQGLFGLDFTCVDVAETPEGPVVFEVSAFGGFRGLEAAHGLNAGDLYAAHVVGKLAGVRS